MRLFSPLTAILIMAMVFGATSAEVCCNFYSCGGGGAPPPPPTTTPLPADPDIQRNVVGLYSYSDDSTDCTGTANVVDPISIVVHIDQHAADVLGASPFVADHLSHHGLNIGAGEFDQYFHSGLGLPPPPSDCVLNEIGQADGGGSSSRNHARGHSQDDVVAWGYGGPWTMAGLTPHYDQVTACGHAVPEDIDGISGYVHTRNMIMSHWIVDAGAQHRYVLQASFWGNDKRIAQCDGEQPQSDGWVYFLGLCDVHGSEITPC